MSIEYMDLISWCWHFGCYLMALGGHYVLVLLFFFSSRRRHTRYWRDWSSDVCSSDLSSCPWHGVLQFPGLRTMVPASLPAAPGRHWDRTEEPAALPEGSGRPEEAAGPGSDLLQHAPFLAPPVRDRAREGRALGAGPEGGLRRGFLPLGSRCQARADGLGPGSLLAHRDKAGANGLGPGFLLAHRGCRGRG